CAGSSLPCRAPALTPCKGEREAKERPGAARHGNTHARASWYVAPDAEAMRALLGRPRSRLGVPRLRRRRLTRLRLGLGTLASLDRRRLVLHSRIARLRLTRRMLTR